MRPKKRHNHLMTPSRPASRTDGLRSALGTVSSSTDPSCRPWPFTVVLHKCVAGTSMIHDVESLLFRIPLLAAIMVLSANILDQTPEVMAQWPKPNYHNPDHLTWLPIYSCIWFGAATIMVAMRFWLRSRGHAGRLGLDDCLLLLAWLGALTFTAVSVVFTRDANGGRHVWDVRPELRSRAVLCMWLAQFAFLICSGATKVSILLFHRRLVAGTYSRKWYWCVWLAIGFTITYTVTFCIVLLLDCQPTRAYWMAFDMKYALTADYSCLGNSEVMNVLAGVVPAVSDLYAVALPCIITWHHAVPRRQRIALNAIFSLGLVVVAASGVRTYYLIRTSGSKDIIRSAYMVFVWAQFELQVGIMCASAPTLRVFFRRYLGGSLASASSSNSSDSQTTLPKSITVLRDSVSGSSVDRRDDADVDS